MNMRFFCSTAILILASCTPKATPPPVDAMATAVAQAAFDLLTGTAAAASPTSPPPTDTLTPPPTDTATPTSAEPKRPVILNYAPCWFGPGPSYALESNISAGKKVDLLGVGSVPGWYIIMNPYFHQACWVRASDIQIDPATDLSAYPVMTPRP